MNETLYSVLKMFSFSLVFVALIIGFIGLHDVDNAINIILFQKIALENGLKLDLVDCSLYSCVDARQEYMIGMAMIFVSFIYLAFVAMYCLMESKPKKEQKNKGCI